MHELCNFSSYINLFSFVSQFYYSSYYGCALYRISSTECLDELRNVFCLILMIFEILHTVAGYIIASCHVHFLGSLFHLSSLPRHIGFSFVTIFVKINSFLHVSRDPFVHICRSRVQGRSQALAHPGTCPSNFCLCPSICLSKF